MSDEPSPSQPEERSEAKQAEAAAPEAAPAEAAAPEGAMIPGGAEWSEVPGLIARGVCMGAADVVPGVSGGTMALILGIYSRFVHGIKSIGPAAVRDALRLRLQAVHAAVAWRFLGAVLVGIGLGIVICTNVIKLPDLLREHPEPVYGLFFGLILGSIGVLGRDVIRAGLRGPIIAAAPIGAGVGFAIVRAVPTDTPEAPWFVFACGCIAISAMILPGISGSFILLILRKYAYILGAFKEFIRPAEDGSRLDPFLNVLVPFGLGCLVGITLFSRFLSWLLRRYEQATLSFMTGLMAGTLYVIWPFQERIYKEFAPGKSKLVSSQPLWPQDTGGALWLTVGLAVTGLVAVLLLDRLAANKAKPSA